MIKINVVIKNGKKFAETKVGFAPLFIKKGAGVNVNCNGIIEAAEKDVCVDSFKGHPCKVTIYAVANYIKEGLNVSDFFEVE